MTLIEAYTRDTQRADFVYDAAQEEAVSALQRVYGDLARADASQAGLLSRLFNRQRRYAVTGLYLWGGVGRGKTYLVDLFFDSLPIAEKKRIHFHRFMRKVHDQLRQHRQLQDPLSKIGTRFAQEFRVLCFDEFIVNDITDAMILGGLLRRLFENGVTLVATSNVAPDDLYKDGLQRDRFLPAIDLIRQHTVVHQIGGNTDYRLRFLDTAEIYFHPHDERAVSGLRSNFEHISSEPGRSHADLEIEGRSIASVRLANGVVWFDFGELCDGPRSQNDYLELARCFHTIIVSDIPVLARETDDHARRFINLIDILYDHNVKFMGSGRCAPHDLYQGERLRLEFNRTASRLAEMQSTNYLAKPHLP